MDKSTYDVIFDPTKDDLSQFVIYNLNGKMLPKKNIGDRWEARVEETIRVFNLNAGQLMALRRQVIDTIKAIKGQLSDDSIRQAVKAGGFPSVVEWVLSLPLESDSISTSDAI